MHTSQDRENSIKFYPIDKKTPCLVNWPKISRDLMKLRKRDIEEGLWVVVFEEDSLIFPGLRRSSQLKVQLTEHRYRC